MSDTPLRQKSERMGDSKLGPRLNTEVAREAPLSIPRFCWRSILIECPMDRRAAGQRRWLLSRLQSIGKTDRCWERPGLVDDRNASTHDCARESAPEDNCKGDRHVVGHRMGPAG